MQELIPQSPWSFKTMGLMKQNYFPVTSPRPRTYKVSLCFYFYLSWAMGIWRDAWHFLLMSTIILFSYKRRH